ncbi:MAG: sulfotransferase family 2 domain-containing protein [Hyphomicrobium sp.]|uniref:sulfotransferase family 2 domain-containing protein n=1 Tax=Hyphomicrobium sp. TaxID=82 RepID=UPI0039E6A5F7
MNENFRPLLFMHIPKTAGTSVLVYLRSVYASRNTLELRWQDDSLGIVTEDAVKGADFLWLHEPFCELPYDTGKFFKITFLRDPIDRVRSAFSYLRDPAVIAEQNFLYTSRRTVRALKEISEMSFREFVLSTDPVHDDNVRAVYRSWFRSDGGVPLATSALPEYLDCMSKCFDYVGTTETLSEDMDAIRRFCFPTYPDKFGRTRENASRKIDADLMLDDAALAVLKEKLYFDFVLYEHAKKLREVHYNRYVLDERCGPAYFV